jgi:hypothetical protein
MNAEAQRIAIAEACEDTEPVPDYLNDLNAMNDAETHMQRSDVTFKTFFVEALENVVRSSLENDFHKKLEMEWACAHATAAQRAEAFLRTLNKWEEPR